jgi:hypothetical protein
VEGWSQGTATFMIAGDAHAVLRVLGGKNR